jgi:hypothetical protein
MATFEVKCNNFRGFIILRMAVLLVFATVFAFLNVEHIFFLRTHPFNEFRGIVYPSVLQRYNYVIVTGTDWPILVKLKMKIVSLESSRSWYLLSLSSIYQHNNFADLWGGNNASAVCCRPLNIVLFRLKGRNHSEDLGVDSTIIILVRRLSSCTEGSKRIHVISARPSYILLLRLVAVWCI